MATKKSLRVFAIAAASGVGLIVLVHLAFLIVNWNDQPPSAAALRLAAVLNRPQPADDDNAYIYMMGMSAKPDQEPGAVGKRHVALIKRAVGLAWTPEIPNLAAPIFDFRALRKPEVNALSTALNNLDGAGVLALERGDSTISEWITSEQWLLDRYVALLKHPAWRELPPDERLPLPPYQFAMEGQKIYLAQAWQFAGKGDSAAVKALLEADLRYWRHSLESSDMLISKMIAVSAIKRHFALAVLALRRLPAAQAPEAMPQQWLTPISDAERSMLNSFAGEWKYMENIIKQTKEPENRSFRTVLYESLFGFTLQAQDTSNNFAEILAASADTLAVPYPKYREALVRANALKARALAGGATPKRMYNISGDVLFKVAVATGYTSYADRTNDIEGMRRIAVLAVGLRARGVTPEQMQQQLDAATERHPYDGTPFVWDAKTGQIVFMGLDERDGGRHAVWY
jgi:hypothetical protein